MPRPTGVSLIYVRNVGTQDITDIDIALGIDAMPPPGTPLSKVPFIDVVSTSTTESAQVKADLWLLPFLNVYGVLGDVQGRADLLVNLDFDSVTPVCRPNPVPFRPPICVGERLGGQQQLFFPTKVSATTLTLGATGVYGVDNWFFTATLNGTLTVSSKDKTDIKSWGGSARVGRRWIYGDNNILAPFLGVSYTDVDTRIQGTATLRGALPGGGDLNARYDVQLDNRDKLLAVVGFNFGFNNGWSAVAEYNWLPGTNSDRAVFAVERRF